MIYNIPDEYKKLKQLMVELDGEEGAEEAITEAFNDLMSDQANGAEVAARLIREAEALNQATKLELERITAVVKNRAARIASAKEAVRATMVATETKTIETALGKFSIRKGSEKTVVKDEEALFSLAIDDEEVSEAVKVETVRKPILKILKKLIEDDKIDSKIAVIQTGDPTIQFK